MKKFLFYIGLVAITFLLPKTVLARPALIPTPTPVTIEGQLTDKGGHAVTGRAIVIWCGDINHFAGQILSDSHGHFSLETDSEKCPLGVSLSAVVYKLNDPTAIDGLALAVVRTHTTVNVKLGVYNPIPVPEYGLLGASTAIMASTGAIFFARRSKP